MKVCDALTGIIRAVGRYSGLLSPHLSLTVFSSESRTFGQRGRQGPAVRFGQNVRQWLKDGVIILDQTI